MFVPNPHWYGKKPFFKKIVFKLLPNNATFESNLRSRSIDMVCPAAGFSHDQAVMLEKRTKGENAPFKVVFVDGTIYAHIDLNLDNPILSDLKVRKALSMAFNKKEIIDPFLEGGGKVAHHFLT